jgi:hypothetical protein
MEVEYTGGCFHSILKTKKSVADQFDAVTSIGQKRIDGLKN